MPDRIVRDELLTSERYWSVGVEAQQLFVHLLLRADSLGRFSGNNFTIRMACYPGHQRNPEMIEKLLNELNDADLIRLYRIGTDQRFVFIPRYRQRLRYTNSKYPSPPNEINDIAIEKSDHSQTTVRPAPLEVKRSKEGTPLARSKSNGKITLDASGSWTGLDASHLALWQKAFPAVNIQTELNKAAAWIVSNPKNKKSNYARFINNWLARSQDSAPRQPSTEKKFVI